MRNLHRDERGQSLVLLAVMGTFLTMMVALVIDAGNSFLQRRQIQNAADAASRAGANFLAQGSYSDTQINSVISVIAAQNNCSSSGTPPCTYTASYINSSGTVLGTVGAGAIPSGAAGIIVTPQRTIVTFLAAVLGQDSTNVSGTASAIFGALGAASCETLFPSVLNGDSDGDGVYDANYTIGACYFIRDDDSAPGGGSFGWVDLNGGGGGASEISTWINNFATSGNTGCNATITVGTASANLATETGTKASLQSATLNLINSANSEISIAIYDTYGTDSNCSNGGTSGSNLCYHVRGFARLRITDVWLTSGGSADPNPDTTPCSQTLFSSNRGIIGQFVGFVDPNGSISASAVGPAKVVNLIN